MGADGPLLGIDIGGSKTAAGVVGVDGRLRSFVQEPTPRGAGTEDLFAAVLALAERAAVEGSPPPIAAGVGCGGPMRFPEGVVSPLHIPAWRGFPLRARLERALGLPAVVDNDAKAFALGQARFGAGRGARCLLGVVVSTGVGGGVVEDGRLRHGASGNAGHVGHVVISARGPRCDCGARGCVTAYASGPALAARAGAALGRDVTAAELAAAAASGDPAAARLLGDAGVALARGIAAAANVLDLDRVVIGGGVSRAGAVLFDPLRAALPRWTRLDFLAGLEVVPAQRPDEAGVLGAAALAADQVGRRG
jgi:glucokinase